MLKDWLGGIAIALTLAFGGAVWWSVKAWADDAAEKAAKSVMDEHAHKHITESDLVNTANETRKELKREIKDSSDNIEKQLALILSMIEMKNQ